MKPLAVLYLIICLSGYAQSKELVKFGIPLQPSAPLYSATDEIYKEAFLRINVDYQSISCIPSSCASLVRDRVISGEAGRQAGYSNIYPQLKRLDVILLNLTVVAITNKEKDPIYTLQDIAKKNYKVSFQSGFRYYQARLEEVIGIEKSDAVVHWISGIKNILKGTTDVYIGIEQLIIPEIDDDLKRQVQISRLEGSNHGMYPFVAIDFPHQQALTKTLLDMKQDRTIERILRENGVSIEPL